MTDAGWHPDPHGRADRRYHDGVRWTEHVADAAGATSIDPPDADPDDPWPATPVIGPPPPRATAPAPGADAAAPADTAPATEPEPSPGEGAPPAPPLAADHTQQLGPAELGKVARPVAADHTVVMTPEDVAKAAALAADAPPPNPDATRHTMPIDPADVEAARRLAAGGAGGGDTSELVIRTGRRRSVIGLVVTVLGIAVGLAALLVLPWTSGSGGDDAYRDLREVVDVSGLPIGGAAIAFVLTGALFAVGAGGVTALARALGSRALRVLAGVVVVLGAGGLAVMGFAAASDVEVASLAIEAEADLGAQAGTPVTLPDGTPVTDPTSGEPVTVGDDGAGAEALTDDQVAAAVREIAEDRLTDAAVVGAVLLAVAAVLLLVGLALDGVPGHAVTAVGLLALTGWAVAAVVQLRSTDLFDPGTGLYLAAAGPLLLAIGAAVPGPRRDRAA